MNDDDTYMKMAIIEDDNGVAELLSRHLRHLFAGNCGIEIAHDFNETRKIIANQKFDIIFLDLNLMPDSPAEQTVKQIPELLQHCNQLVIISGVEGGTYGPEAISKGALGFLKKTESIVTSKTFIEKLVGLYRAFKGTSEIEHNLKKLETILKRNVPTHG